MSRTFSTNCGSVESLNVCVRCGCRPKARQVLRFTEDEHHARQHQDIDRRHLSGDPKKHMVCYLAEFEWRFNHRFDLAGMIPALARAAAQSKPVT